MNVSGILILLSAVELACAACFADVPSLKQRQDPFYNGASAQLTSINKGNSNIFSSVLAGQGEYAWDSGIAVEGVVPAVLAQGGVSATGPGVPRIGGLMDGRIEVDGLFRAYGDTYDYLAFQFGVGLPYQSSTVEQHSSNASWLLPIAAFGRIDWDWIALQPELTDSPSFPSSWYSGTTHIVGDATNSVSLSLTAFFYPARWISPLVGYEEIFPSSVTYSTEPSGVAGYFASATLTTGRTRELRIGAELGPDYVPVLLTLEAQYIPVTPLSSDSVYAGEADIRWLF